MARRLDLLRQILAAGIAALQAEKVFVALIESIEAELRSVLARQRAKDDLRAGILRTASFLWNHRRVGAAAEKVCAIEVIERRHRQQQPGVDGAHPGEIHKRISLALPVATACGLRLPVV